MRYARVDEVFNERPRLSGRVVSLQADVEEENGGWDWVKVREGGTQGQRVKESKRQKRKGQGRAGQGRAGQGKGRHGRKEAS
jgi:hypothetical protein